MTITTHLFEAFLKCPTKCYLRSLGEKVTENVYADWVRTQTESYHSDGVRRLVEGLTENERVIAAPATEILKVAKWRIAVDLVARAQNLESVLHAVERVPPKEQGQPAQFIPIRFIFTNKLTSYDKLLLAFDALVLSEMLRSEILHGKIIHGDDHSMLRVKTSASANEVRKRAEKIGALLSAHSAPDLILNHHCVECEHIDETSVKLRGLKGYVWVLAGMDKVYYFYKPSREGSFLQEMLRSFSGVLISDFYTAYDSLNCVQQKCLVHFVRDIDDDVLKNPLDTELKGIAQEFGTLLRTIIQTVDRYGLKSGHLRKHKPAAFQFLNSVVSRDFSSELANSYKKRFQKSGEKMFTFLDHDGAPWNNINAEHAIKSFAKFRTHADGRFTERSLKEYLVLASVFQTCEFNNVNVLKFLLSKETTLEGLLKIAGRKTKSSGDPRVVARCEGHCQSMH